MNIEDSKKLGKYLKLGICTSMLLSMACGFAGSTIFKVGMVFLFLFSPLQYFGFYFGVLGREFPITGRRVLTTITFILAFVYFLSMGSVFFTVIHVIQWGCREWGLKNYGKGYNTAKKLFNEYLENPEDIPEAYRD